MMNARSVQIGECADVSPGFSTKGALRSEPDGTHQVVMGGHLTQGEPYVYKKGDRLRITPDRKADRYEVKGGNILYMSRGLVTYPVLVESVPELTIAPSTFFILRPHREVEPAYLVWALERRSTKAILASLRTKAGTPTIPRKGFMEIPIPLPDLVTQQRIAKLWRLQNRETQLQQQLMDETKRFHRQSGQRIFEDLMNDQERT